MLTFAIALTVAAAPPAPWLNNYDVALKQSARQDKPVFLYFTNSAGKPDAVRDVNDIGQLTKDFIPVFVDKNDENGRKLFSVFEVSGDDACVVVERNRQWQFCRYERKLTRSELETVATTAKDAKGLPTRDPLAQTSMYVSPETATAGQPMMGQPVYQPAQSWTINGASGGSSGGCPSCQRRR